MTDACTCLEWRQELPLAFHRMMTARLAREGIDVAETWAAQIPQVVPPQHRIWCAQAKGGYDAQGYVYFIRAGETGAIKIGSTSNVVRRLADLQCASPLRLALIAKAPGGMPLERRLHRAFKRERVMGEWFRPTVPILLRAHELDDRDGRRHTPDEVYAFGMNSSGEDSSVLRDRKASGRDLTLADFEQMAARVTA